MVTLPEHIQVAVASARDLDAGRVAPSVVPRAAKWLLDIFDAYCVGPEAAERSRAVINALNAPDQIEVAW